MQELDFSEGANLDRLFKSGVEEPEYIPHLASTDWYSDEEYLLLKISTYGCLVTQW